MGLDLKIERQPGAAGAWLIVVAGDLDAASAPAFRRSLASELPASDEAVVLDLSRLRFLDSSGLTLIVELHLRLAGAGAELVLVRPNHHIERTLAVTGVGSFIRAEATRADAFLSLGAPYASEPAG